jgi:hypothetical protein
MKHEIYAVLGMRLFYCAVASLIFGSEALSSPQDFNNKMAEKMPEAKIENFEKLNSIYLDAFKSQNAAFFNKLRIEFDHRYKGYLIIGACQGKFRHGINYGHAISLANPKNKTAVYLVAMSNKIKYDYLYELQRFHIDFSEQGYIKGRGGEIICLSSKEAKELSKNYSNAKDKAEGFTNLNLRTNLDIACGTQADGDMEFICFEYDKRIQRFRNAGGWKNE